MCVVGFRLDYSEKNMKLINIVYIYIDIYYNRMSVGYRFLLFVFFLSNFIFIY